MHAHITRRKGRARAVSRAIFMGFVFCLVTPRITPGHCNGIPGHCIIIPGHYIRRLRRWKVTGWNRGCLARKWVMNPRETTFMQRRGHSGRYSCCRRGVHDRSPVCYAGACQVLFDLVWLLIPGSNLSMGGCDRSWRSVGGYRVSLFDCGWSGHYLCCGCDACWGWRFAFCPAAVPGVSSGQQRQVGSRSRGRRSRSSSEGADRRTRERSRGGLLLLTALRVVGGGAIALPQIHLRMTELTLLLPDPGMRLEVRVLVALPGILTARLVLGRRGLLQGMSLAGWSASSIA